MEHDMDEEQEEGVCISLRIPFHTCRDAQDTGQQQQNEAHV